MERDRREKTRYSTLRPLSPGVKMSTDSFSGGRPSQENKTAMSEEVPPSPSNGCGNRPSWHEEAPFQLQSL